MKIIKRNGAEVPFDITKIITAVTKASDSVSGQSRLTKDQITQIAAAVTDQCQALNRAVSVEEVQDMVENQLMDIKAHDVARHYITYRYVQSLKRQTNTTDERILSLIECQNEEVKQENANKNPTVNSVQRDYMAGEISKDLTARLLLDPEIVKAHQEGLIHFHDSDYFAQHMHNCDLVNLEDMLQNGTVISGTYIEKPHSFSTACNIATQIIAQVASNQYGGQSISLTHLAPFVDVSRKKIRRDVEAEMQDLGIDPGEEKLSEIVEKRLRELIKNDRYLNEKEKDHYADYLESEETPQYEIDTQRKMARQRFIDANRDLPPADKRDTLALRLSDFIRDLDGYEKDLLENVERTDLADVTAEQMEQHLGDPSTVQQLIDFLRIRLSLECLHCLTDEETEYLLVARAVLRNVLFASGKHVGKNLLISGIIADDFQPMRLDIAFDVLPAVKGIGKHLSCALAVESACGNSGNDCTQSLSA